MKEITNRQQELYLFMINFFMENHNLPSFQIIADKFGIKSKFAILKHIEALTKKGYLKPAPDYPGRYKFNMGLDDLILIY